MTLKSGAAAVHPAKARWEEEAKLGRRLRVGERLEGLVENLANVFQLMADG